MRPPEWKRKGIGRAHQGGVSGIYSRKPLVPSIRAIVYWRDEEGRVNKYFALLHKGYQPKGFDTPPRPHYARIVRGEQVVAEWKPSR